jgi:SagB-type dehydrogenase family enzyme
LYESDNGVVLVSMTGGLTLTLGLDAAKIARRLQSDWLAEDDTLEMTDDLSQGFFALIQMQKKGMLDARIMKGDDILFSISPSPLDSAYKSKVKSNGAYQLNRYAYMRQQDKVLLLESPLTLCRIVVIDEKLAGMLHRLCGGRSLDIADDATQCFLSALITLGIAEPAQEGGEDRHMEFWQFHDLLFYARTLGGKNAYPLGGTYRFQGKRPTPEAMREPISHEFVALPVPSKTLVGLLGRPFSEVLGKRRSRRIFSSGTIALEELGAFLYAAAKVTDVHADSEHDDEVTMRPSPGGGARHALEIYPLVRRCAGLPPGAYRYDPLNHRLEKVSLDVKAFERLLEDNPYESLGDETPQLTLYISARIGRTAWKYESIAYKLLNQDLGCLYQTFYLVATALGLAPCALGSVNTAELGAVMRIDWREEPFIGAFTLGIE